MTTLRTLQAAIAFAGACVAATAALGQQPAKWVKLAGGKAEVRLPAGYRVDTGAGDILRVASGGLAAVRFSLELQAAGGAGASRKSGEAFVRELAKKQDLKLHRSGNKVVLMEPRTTGRLDGREVRNMQLHIGFGRSVVVMALTVFEGEKDSDAVQRFFDKDMEQIIRSLRRIGA
jgi:hypothetical protein